MRRELLLGDTTRSVAALGFLGGASSGVLLSVGTSAFEVSIRTPGQKRETRKRKSGGGLTVHQLAGG